MSSPFEIDTKGTCVLCLSANVPNLISKDKDLGSDLNSKATAFKMFLRYLKVNFTALINNNQHSASTGKFDHLEVSLCDECSSSAIDFLQLFQEFESIRLQLDLVVGQLHEFMEKGRKDPDRVREFRRRMDTGKMEDERSSKIADALRKETMQKAALRVNCSAPRISFQRTRKPEEEPAAGNNVKTETSPLDLDKNIDFDIKQEPKEADTGDRGSAQKKKLVPVPTNDSLIVDPEPVLEETESTYLAEEGHEKQENDSLSDIIGTISDKLVLTDQVQMKASQQWACEYCGHNYSRRDALRNHQINKHTVPFLTAEGSLPPGISEQDFNGAVADIMTERTASVNECPICGLSGFKYNALVRTHIFRSHLPDVISAMENNKVTDETMVDSDSSSKDVFEKHCVQLQLGDMKRWKCIPCGKCFSEKGHLQTHQLQKHMMTVLQSSLTPLCSEQKMTTVMKRIVGKSKILRKVLGAPMYECHFCKKEVWNNLKVHLLKFHLEIVIREMEESLDAGGGTQTQRSTQQSTQRSTQRRTQRGTQRSTLNAYLTK